MTGTTSVKSGKGRVHGVVSELSALMTVKEGHIDEMKAAIKVFEDRLRDAGTKSTLQRIGLRSLRFVLFDDDHRLMWLTSFESEWDPYVDDAVALVGLPVWADWLQHTNEFTIEDVDAATNADIKAFLQSGQIEAAGFWDYFGDVTQPQVTKALRVDRAFQQVLDDPAAQEALAHPALAPLLQQAAD
ncbi:hypothetical protein [Modestobacter marinus]|uniref:hypothetical protein n=1 Tax=Modestobacter marinus TaxID=477641 RepID=UPI001C986F5A|nr:hypothetical protein [Modestobacter marinus]